MSSQQRGKTDSRWEQNRRQQNSHCHLRYVCVGVYSRCHQVCVYVCVGLCVYHSACSCGLATCSAVQVWVTEPKTQSWRVVDTDLYHQRPHTHTFVRACVSTLVAEYTSSLLSFCVLPTCALWVESTCVVSVCPPFPGCWKEGENCLAVTLAMRLSSWAFWAAPTAASALPCAWAVLTHRRQGTEQDEHNQ